MAAGDRSEAAESGKATVGLKNEAVNLENGTVNLQNGTVNLGNGTVNLRWHSWCYFEVKSGVFKLMDGSVKAEPCTSGS